MTVGQESFERSKARAKHIDKPAGAKATGVNRNTYGTLAKEFIVAKGGKGFLIAPRFLRIKGEVAEKTTDEWGAWLAYFFRLGMKTDLMEAHGFYTVPAQWPHDFDDNATPEESYEAARHYRERLHHRIATEAANKEDPVAVGERIRTFVADVKRCMPIWEEPKPVAKPLEFTPEEMKESLARCMAHGRTA